MNRKRTDYLIQYFVSLLIALLLGSWSHSWYETLSISLFLFLIIKFTYDLGKTMSIKNIIAIIATMQYLIGPILGYAYNDSLPLGYRMQIPKEVYFSFVLPASIFYFIGLFWRLNKLSSTVNFESNNVDYFKKGRLLIIIGFISDFFSLGFVGFILGGLKFVGLFYMFSSKHPLKYYWMIPVFGVLVSNTLNSGMFHELILWGCFFLMTYYIFRKTKFVVRLTTIIVGLCLIFLIQLVKKDYRMAMSDNQLNTGKGELFLDQFKKKFSGTGASLSDEDIANNVVRLNQGWIISYVMQNVPEHRPYAEGLTIKDAIVASIFPRFLMPDKVIADGHSNMINYAGIELSSTTAMDIGQMGEAYANFGVFGGIIFMFLLGLFLNWVVTFLERKSLKYPDIIFWVPLIFLQSIKAETDVAIILNHITKTALVTWFFFTPFAKFLINIRSTNTNEFHSFIE